MDTSDLGKRMKQYEDVNNIKLIDKLPLVIRMDGVGFHSFTRGMKRPFDDILNRSMQWTMKKLCEEIPSCVLGYTQSDEITLVLVDYDNPVSQPWRGYVKRKIESITAAMATRDFNNCLADVTIQEFTKAILGTDDGETLKKNFEVYLKRAGNAIFDSRAFNLPIFEVENNLIWRQLDCVRNSVQSVGRANFSHKTLQNKSCKQIREMLLTEKGIEWENFPTYLKRGSCCIKESVEIDTDKGKVTRGKWKIDNEIPIFTQDREYIRKRILYKE